MLYAPSYLNLIKIRQIFQSVAWIASSNRKQGDAMMRIFYNPYVYYIKIEKKIRYISVLTTAT